MFEPAVLKEQLEGDNDAMDAVLTMFVAEHQNDAKTLREHVNAGELARARTLIHNIKGVAGNIGAEALQQCCVQVENRLRNGEWIGENDIKQFEKLLCVTIQTVQKEIENANKITAS
ncbi:Hpt domain-containing protein [Grimontia hollisae]|uniref:Hpt domain-containing protein n=1 Tax=Grimontia hollisae TaxID=673 RepID=UPI000DFBA3AB|nr:Hpt domain-containing protein [Grimontia hollisae]STQ76535.1 two component system sensor kinase SsrA [Grimontia hollisae]